MYFHPPSRSNCTLFCLGVQFVPRDSLHIPNSRKIFSVRMKVIFGEKSLSSLFRILTQELITVFPAMWYRFTRAKGAENWSRAVHVRPRGFERCTAIFGASFAGLFWALQAPCGVASNWKERHGSTPQFYTTLDHILAHLLVSPWPTKNMQFCRVDQTVLHVDRSLLGCCGQFRRPLQRILLHIYRWKQQ